MRASGDEPSYGHRPSSAFTPALIERAVEPQCHGSGSPAPMPASRSARYSASATSTMRTVPARRAWRTAALALNITASAPPTSTMPAMRTPDGCDRRAAKRTAASDATRANAVIASSQLCRDRRGDAASTGSAQTPRTRAAEVLMRLSRCGAGLPAARSSRPPRRPPAPPRQAGGRPGREPPPPPVRGARKR